MQRSYRDIIEDLRQFHTVSDEELAILLSDGMTPHGVTALPAVHDFSSADIFAQTFSDMPDALTQALSDAADACRREIYGTDVYIRGLIEFTNCCRNNCYYCGIRRDNEAVTRYRLTKDEILSCCETGYAAGFRTFVLQGGEDFSYSDDTICDIIASIRNTYPNCAVTLSLGERERASYQAYFDAGASRYLLRHETADDMHYKCLHPPELSPAHRRECLLVLKDIGFQTGAGCMVGSPYQTTAHLVSDLRFLQSLEPDMVGIGPFISQSDTPFCDMPNGSLVLVLRMLSIVRLMLPHVLLPATTALATLSPDGRRLGLKAGANVVMPNLSPAHVRKHYRLYDNKLSSGVEAAEALDLLKQEVSDAGYRIVTAKGDVKHIR